MRNKKKAHRAPERKSDLSNFIMEDTMHARIRPSAAYQWVNCPASVKLSERAPHEESPYMAAGTLAHKIAEALLKESPISELRKDENYTPELEDLAKEYVSYVREHTPPHAEIVVEETVQIAEGEENIFGTPDCVIYSPGEIQIFDFKSGAGQLVTDNTQLALYALGAKANYSERRFGRPLEKVTLHIVQPALDNYNAREYTMEIIDEYLIKIVFPKIDEALHNPGFSVPGKWCTGCAGRAFCYESGEKYKRFDTSVPLSELTVGEMAEMLDMLEGVIGYRDKLKKALTETLKSGVPVAGYTLAPGRNKRVWTDSKELADKASALGLTTLLSPAQMQKKLGKKRFEEDFGEFVETVEGAPVLKKEAD